MHEEYGCENWAFRKQMLYGVCPGVPVARSLSPGQSPTDGPFQVGSVFWVPPAPPLHQPKVVPDNASATCATSCKTCESASRRVETSYQTGSATTGPGCLTTLGDSDANFKLAVANVGEFGTVGASQGAVHDTVTHVNIFSYAAQGPEGHEVLVMVLIVLMYVCLFRELGAGVFAFSQSQRRAQRE
ncbi:hypothetical protein PsYK624_172470 [Phanerochaete sordida]|uniref:Uncharacterized protein n=1 Tax=Phanerochaete sordida TaxID=48140 RepID=A0A9P3GSU9_9APHY|nr:hypothetical protein PsYK624_172470 [Phanerochaete sordida]